MSWTERVAGADPSCRRFPGTFDEPGIDKRTMRAGRCPSMRATGASTGLQVTIGDA